MAHRIWLIAIFVSSATCCRGDWVWIEGEKPNRSTMNRHPRWYDQVKRDQFSGKDHISNFSDDKPGEAEYRIRLKSAGKYTLWVRCNPIQSKLSYRVDGGRSVAIITSGNNLDSINVAADDKPDLRFLAWVDAGKIDLTEGEHRILFRMEGGLHNHGYLDCFMLTTEAFVPRGSRKPNEMAADAKRIAEENKGWFPFAPSADEFSNASAIDLRFLNEKYAGEKGRIIAKGDHFVHEKTNEPVRFWAVNIGHSKKSLADLKRDARLLAKYGVNLVRLHGKVFDQNGDVDRSAVKHLHDVVAAMKSEGIYTHLSIYFPLWLDPKPNTPWLKGYNGQKHSFATLFFNTDFQEQYQRWWKAILTDPGPKSGAAEFLVDEPAVFGAEIVNEDSLFFWTFNEREIPENQLAIFETYFGLWLKVKYGTLESALDAWKSQPLPRDKPSEGRMAFRPLWNIANERTARDKDTARFLAETQRRFYEQQIQYLRSIGFKGLIHCSNWITASPEVLTPIEKYTYSVGDFIDRHGYFGCLGRGDNSAWSIRDNHTYAHRSALRFEAEEPNKPRVFSHPVIDPKYAGKPSMISETAFTRPNRYRSEAPLYYAVYGALQDSDCIVHFTFDGSHWQVKPNFFMQPWTITTPAMLGQFPAAAFIYRKGLARTADTIAKVDLNVDDLLNLKGTPLRQDAALDELRLKDVPLDRQNDSASALIDPLIHYVGKTEVSFVKTPTKISVPDLSKYIDRKARTVKSATGEVALNYEHGLLTLNAPEAQAVSGNLKEAGATRLATIEVDSSMTNGHIVAVSLDDKPLAESNRILLQAMSEEKATDFRVEQLSDRERRITSIGRDPWLVRDIAGVVRFQRPDADALRIVALDFLGQPTTDNSKGGTLQLKSNVIYYLVTKE